MITTAKRGVQVDATSRSAQSQRCRLCQRRGDKAKYATAAITDSGSMAEYPAPANRKSAKVAEAALTHPANKISALAAVN